MKRQYLSIGFICLAVSIIYLISCSSTPITGGGSGSSSSSLGPYQAAFEKYGPLQVVSNQLCDSNGAPVQLRGFSSHGLQSSWYPQFMSLQSIGWMATNWRIDVIRAAMYTKEGGYIDDPAPIKAKVEEIIQAAVKLNIYCVIDWHILNLDGNPNDYKANAMAFFTNMAAKYGTNKNLFYEICNEPNSSAYAYTVDWTNHIKPYAEYMITNIRKVDSNTIIIVGTGNWSQKVDDAAASPLAYSNIMYALHFYSGTHTQWLRDRADAAMSNGIAIFVTEWGTSDSSGDNGPYLTEAGNWLNWAASNNVSWCNWSLCDKAETSAALISGSPTTGGWIDGYLTTSGLYVKNKILYR